MPIDPNVIRDLEPVRHFVEAAGTFCGLIENHEALAPYELARRTAELLPVLYAAGLALPDVPMPKVQSEKPDAFYDSVPIKHTAALSRALGEKLGAYNRYWQVSDPFEGEEPVVALLGEDLADMYGDLKRGLIAFDRQDAASGAPTEHDAAEAAWHWRFSFGNHWGRHLVSALRALHYIPSTEYRVPSTEYRVS